jgi:hypothetical protein
MKLTVRSDHSCMSGSIARWILVVLVALTRQVTAGQGTTYDRFYTAFGKNDLSTIRSIRDETITMPWCAGLVEACNSHLGSARSGLDRQTTSSGLGPHRITCPRTGGDHNQPFLPYAQTSPPGVHRTTHRSFRDIPWPQHARSRIEGHS